MKKAALGLIILTLTFLSGHGAEANGLAGLRLEKVVGPYIIDIGTDQFAAPEPGTPIQFDFNLLSSSTREYLSFDHVAVEIKNPDSGDLLKKDLPESQDGFTALTVVFPKAGLYTMDVNIFKDNKSATSASFQIQIGAPVSTGLNPWQALELAVPIIMVLVAILVSIWQKKKQ